MSKNILIIHGHPVNDTFIDQLQQAYTDAAKSRAASVRKLVLREKHFNINFSEGYRGNQALEKDLIEAQEAISWADHLVFFYPNWWGTYPALLKGFIDRTFLPGFAFKYRSGRTDPERLLKGKTARLVVTMDSPKWYYYLVQMAPGHHAMRKGLLHFCGIRPVRITTLGLLRTANEKQRQKWIALMKKIGNKMI
ncbi:MAG: NAD(P)H-dependent oxidoreductase [Bacteroidetes bacterium]|nr:NAD(P)H-dependent oxidoreductase [Bacteroidota bacterium]MBU1579308.1 NAD(P)H-dependent oxidoreductase [Bacteroidota bacterium]MBU2556812.1 NAD(P)H-dependent oxidoreductase [Bacteroidota bacterium]